MGMDYDIIHIHILSIFLIAQIRSHSSSIETMYLEVKSQGKVRFNMNIYIHLYNLQIEGKKTVLTLNIQIPN